MTGELEGKVAIVTGAASGIGRASAELFADEGARVVIADLDAEGGEAVAAGIGNNAAFRYADVSRGDDVQALVDFTVDRFGGLDIMYNNAGIPGIPSGTVDEDGFSDFERIMSINVLGVMLGTQRAARHMARHGGGSIVITASVAGTFAGYGQATYRAAKAGVLQFARSAAIEYGPMGVRINCINPLGIPTGMLHEDVCKAMIASQPLKRLASPLDVANVALFFASDRSAQVTGQDIAVDGGFSIGDTTNYVEQMAAIQGDA